MQLKDVLSCPIVFNTFNWLIGDNFARTTLVNEYIQPLPGESVLDIGCGTGSMLTYLPDNTEYVGFDSSLEYINAAKSHFGERGKFICEHISDETIAKLKFNMKFDIILAIGVIHHLNAEEALKLFEIAHLILKEGGRIISIDGVYVEKQSVFAKWIISNDRGNHIRTDKEYYSIANKFFSNVQASIRYDLLTIPYTHLIMKCTKG